MIHLVYIIGFDMANIVDWNADFIHPKETMPYNQMGPFNILLVV